MSIIGYSLLLFLRIFSWILALRIIIEMIQSFSRQFNPPRWFMVVAEPLFLGGVALDMSILVLFLILMVLQMVVVAVFL